jgi:hypothetical protein
VRDEAERRAVTEALAAADGNVSRAANLLGVSRPTVYDLMQRHGLAASGAEAATDIDGTLRSIAHGRRKGSMSMALDDASVFRRPAGRGTLLFWPKQQCPPPGLRWPLFLAIVLGWSFTGRRRCPCQDRWTGDPTYSHGYLVAAVSAWMIWRAWRRGELEGTRPSLFGLVPLALAGLTCGCRARRSSIQVVQQLMLPALLLGVAGRCSAGAASSRCWCRSACSTGGAGVGTLRPPLQHMTFRRRRTSLHSVGIPAYLHGHRVELPAAASRSSRAAAACICSWPPARSRRSRPTFTSALLGARRADGRGAGRRDRRQLDPHRGHSSSPAT